MNYESIAFIKENDYIELHRYSFTDMDLNVIIT